MSKHILLVEDTKELAENLADFLRMEGYEVTIAENGAKGIAFLQAVRPDAIITDLLMPEMSGIEFIRTVRSDNRQQAVPIIIVSARVGAESRDEGFEAGANLFLDKPIDSDLLLESLVELTSSKAWKK